MTKQPSSAPANARHAGHAQPVDAWEDEAEVDDFKPLTREEARQWRQRHPDTSAWRVVRWQVLLTLLAAVAVGGITQRISWAWSVAYGGMCIALPSALMAYGLTSSSLSRLLAKALPGMAKVSLAGVLFWEGVKVLCALAMMVAAPRVVPDLNWLALVAGLVVVLKAYWLAFWWGSRQAH